MSVKPFCLITIRDSDEVADAEAASVRAFGGLAPGELVQVRPEITPLSQLRLDDYSGIIVGGSHFNASDEVKDDEQIAIEADLGRIVDESIERDHPLLGVCYGLGFVARRLGGTVDKRFGEKAGVTTVEVTAHGENDPLFEGLPTSFLAFTGHKEACSLLPDDAVLLATGRACPVQAFRVGKRVYLTQFHVELDAGTLEQRMRIYADYGYFRPEELEMLVEENHSAGVGEEPRSIMARFCSMMREEREES